MEEEKPRTILNGQGKSKIGGFSTKMLPKWIKPQPHSLSDTLSVMLVGDETYQRQGTLPMPWPPLILSPQFFLVILKFLRFLLLWIQNFQI